MGGFQQPSKLTPACAQVPALFLWNVLLFLPGTFLPLNSLLPSKGLKMGPGQAPTGAAWLDDVQLCVSPPRASPWFPGQLQRTAYPRKVGAPGWSAQVNRDLRVQGEDPQDKSPDSVPVSRAGSVRSTRRGVQRTGKSHPHTARPCAASGGRGGRCEADQTRGGGAEAPVCVGVRLSQQFILPHWLMEGPREVTIKFTSRGPFTSQQSPLLLSPG